jgi:hypothetical protein
VLAGAGVLSVLILAASAVFGDNAPSQTVRAEVGDSAQDHTPDQQGTDTENNARPRPTVSDAPRGNAAEGGGIHHIAEVAAASPTREVRAVAPMSGTHTSTPTKTPQTDPTQQHWTTTVVNGTSVLEPGQSWVTNRITLVFQGDGNLVLYDKKGTALWWSGTIGRGAKTVFQADGNLVVYTQDGQTAWASQTMGHSGARLVLEADGNVTIRSGNAVLWSTGTAM